MLWRILQKEACSSVIIEFITNYSKRSRQLLVTSELTYQIENKHRLGDNKQTRINSLIYRARVDSLVQRILKENLTSYPVVFAFDGEKYAIRIGEKRKPRRIINMELIQLRFTYRKIHEDWNKLLHHYMMKENN